MRAIAVTVIAAALLVAGVLASVGADDRGAPRIQKAATGV